MTRIRTIAALIALGALAPVAAPQAALAESIDAKNDPTVPYSEARRAADDESLFATRDSRGFLGLGLMPPPQAGRGHSAVDDVHRLRHVR